MDSLKNLINGLYGHIEDQEAILAETNLFGFFKKLEAIEARLLNEKSNGSIEEEGNELNDENFRN